MKNLLPWLLSLALLIYLQRQPSVERTADLISPSREEVKAEFDTWKAQFHLGAPDRQERLALVKKSEADVRHHIMTALSQQHTLEAALPPTTPQEVQAWHQKNREQLRIPPLYHLSHLFLASHNRPPKDRQAEAEKIFELFRRGHTFASLVSQHSEDDRTRTVGGDLGWLTLHRLPKDLTQAIAQLKKGQLSRPIQTHLGWHLFLLTDHRPSRIPTLLETETEIFSILDHQKRQNLVSISPVQH